MKSERKDLSVLQGASTTQQPLDYIQTTQLTQNKQLFALSLVALGNKEKKRIKLIRERDACNSIFEPKELRS